MHEPESGFFTATYIEGIEGAAQPIAAQLRDYRAALTAAAARLDVLERRDPVNHFLVLAVWPAPEVHEEHVERSAELERRLERHLAAPTDTRLHNALSVAATRASSAGSVVVATHVDVVPQHKDAAVEALRQLAHNSRGHDGNLRFDVWQQTNRPNHFTVVESWAHINALARHGSAAETRGFRAALAPMSGALYDERLYFELA